MNNATGRGVQNYDESFREQVLKHFELHGVVATCSKFKICNSTIYNWLRSGIQHKRKLRYSRETRKQAMAAVDVHGAVATGRALGLPLALLRRWEAEDMRPRLEKEENVTISNVEEKVMQTIDVDLTLNNKEEEVTLKKEKLN